MRLTLTPGAQALLATCVVIAVVAFLVVVFGFPGWWKHKAFAIRNAAFRGSGREHEQPDTEISRATMQATSGGTDHGTVANIQSDSKCHWRFFCLWFVLSSRSRLQRTAGRGERVEGVIPAIHTRDDREYLLASTGSVFENATLERPGDLLEMDLFTVQENQRHVLDQRP